MNEPAKLVTIVAALAGLITSSVVAQRNYDPKTVETVQGKVLSVEKTSPPAQHGHGVHLMLQTAKETIEVHLGPAGFVEKQAMKIAANDTITVTGSRIMMNGKPAIVAAQIKKGDEVLKLRDENGVPAWSGGRRGR
ncbi:MAG: DNA-binding protein [Chthoniobacterales bacterium]